MRYVCIGDNEWYVVETNITDNIGPRKGDIVTKVGEEQNGEYYIFKEWPGDSFYYASFVPINEASAETGMVEVTFEDIKKLIPSYSN